MRDEINNIVLIIVCVGLLVWAIWPEKSAVKYTVRAVEFFALMKPYDGFYQECHEASVELHRDTVKIAPSSRDIESIMLRGKQICGYDHTIGITKNVAIAITEAIKVPLPSSLPYDLSKRVLNNHYTNKEDCKTIVETLLLTCPTLTKRLIIKQ